MEVRDRPKGRVRARWCTCGEPRKRHHLFCRECWLALPASVRLRLLRRCRRVRRRAILERAGSLPPSGVAPRRRRAVV